VAERRATPLAARGYGGLVLERLTEQASTICGLDRSMLIVRDREDPERVIAVAGHNVEHERLGERREWRGGGAGRVLATGRAILVEDYRGPGEGSARRPRRFARTELAVPIPRPGAAPAGALTGVSLSPERRYGFREVRRLAEIAALAGRALEHYEDGRRAPEPSVEREVDRLAGEIARRDGYTGEHSHAVGELALSVGRALGLAAVDLLELEFASRLHDIGKLRIPDRILRKPGPLSEGQWRVMRRHPELGAAMLADLPGLQAIATIVRYHHERWDGGGYPDGLRDGQIPIAARIVACCDAFLAMTSDRPYRRALEPDRALAELAAGAGTQFDPGVVSAASAVVEGSRPR
jgi:HD domain/GAF domain